MFPEQEDEVPIVAIDLDGMLASLLGPQVQRTCILCGQPSTILSPCKGCGPEAWEDEFVPGYGDETRQRRRQELASYLQHNQHDPEKVKFAVGHAYNPGGCLVCLSCWTHATQPERNLICPLYLLHERLEAQETHWPLIHKASFWAYIGRNLSEWWEQVRTFWCQTWNTSTDTAVHREVAEWRKALLDAASGPGSP